MELKNIAIHEMISTEIKVKVETKDDEVKINELISVLSSGEKNRYISKVKKLTLGVNYETFPDTGLSDTGLYDDVIGEEWWDNSCNTVIKLLIENNHLNLECFTLYCFEIGRIDLSELISTNSKTLKEVQVFTMCGKITDQHINMFSKHCNNLEFFSMTVHPLNCFEVNRYITDKAVIRLVSANPKIKYLDLGSCEKLTNISLECIALFLGKELQGISLNRTQITKNALNLFPSSEQLKRVSLEGCSHISPQDINAIKGLMPKTNFIY
uniref:RNI-like protein n=1 Tax=Rhizophagus irregularis (strain DAOM 181602 / DAOM 197198 / MUCL 43194) TaxID=747089 RepID=U9T5W6_RHIID